MDPFIRIGYPVTFGLVIFFSIVEMCIAAWLTAKYNAHHNYHTSGERARVRYLLFTSLWTIVMGSAYLGVFVIAVNNIISSIASHALFLFITWALWLAGAAAMTETVGGTLNCSVQTVFAYCGHLNALIGFAWLIFVFLSFLFLFVILRGITSRKNGEGYGRPIVEA